MFQKLAKVSMACHRVDNGKKISKKDKNVEDDCLLKTILTPHVDETILYNITHIFFPA